MSVPTVTSIDPGSGPAGTQVVITGTGFREDTSAVLFGAVSVGTRFAVVSETQILAYVPEAAGTVHVTVTTPEGTSATSSADQFTVDPCVGPPGGGAGDPPTVTSVVPSAAIDNDGGDTIAVHGTGFTTTVAVRFGIQAEAPQGVFEVVDDTELSVLTPPGSGTVDVIVTTSYGESATSAADEFTYPDAAPPAVTGIAPSGGYYGSKVTITGTGFDDATAVYFGDEPAPFTATADDTIVCYVPEGSGVVHVTVEGPGGASAETTDDLFTYGASGLPRTTASANVARSGYDGWASGNQNVTLYPDAAGGYSIAGTYYTLDGGGLTEYAGPFVVSGGGSHLLQYWSVDVRGNVEPVNVGYVNILSASAVPTGLTAVAVGTGQILVSWDRVASQTPVTYRLYTGAASPPTTLVVATGQNVVTVKQTIADGARYFAVSSVDVAGGESAKSAAVGPVSAQQIGSVDIADAAVSIAKFATGIVPTRVVAALPALPDAAYPAGSTALLTTDGKLYKAKTGLGGSWVAVANAGDLTGQITSTQISDDAVTTAKIAANAVTAAEIAANTITAAQIAADTITAGQIAAGAIGASEIAAGAVVAGKIAALSITGAEIAAGAITAAKIAAGTITAAEIAASTITAAKLNIADVKANVVTADAIAAVNITAVNISGGNISGVNITGQTITGGTIRTAASGHRVEISPQAYMDIRMPSGYSGTEYNPAALGAYYNASDPDSPVLNISGPDIGWGQAGITITGTGMIDLFPTSPSTPRVRVWGALRLMDNWVSGTSEDGIWIQDNNVTSRRYKLYFDSSNGRLYCRRDASIYSFFNRSGGSSTI